MAKTKDPYKQVWAQDTESLASEWNENSTLFAPSYGDMASRMIGKARYHLRVARKLNGTPDAEVEFNKALSYQRIAKSMLARHERVIALSR